MKENPLSCGIEMLRSTPSRFPNKRRNLINRITGECRTLVTRCSIQSTEPHPYNSPFNFIFKGIL